MPEDNLIISSRIDQTERSVSDMKGRFDKHEEFVHAKFNNLEEQNRVTEANIISGIKDLSRQIESRFLTTAETTTRDIKELHAKIDHTSENIAERREMNVPTLLTIIGLIWIVTVALVTWGSSQYATSQINKVRTDDVESDMKSHTDLPAHTGALQEFTSLEKDIERIDERHDTLLKDFKDLLPNVESIKTSRFTHIDGTILRQEIERIDAVLQLQSNREIEKNAAINAEQTAKIDFITKLHEKQLDQLLRQ